MKTKEHLAVRFIKSSGIFFIGNVLSKAIVFILLPIYTSYISPADYGYYDLSTTYMTVITAVLFLEFWSCVLRYLYEREGREEKSRVVLSGLVIFAGSTGAYIILAIILHLFLPVPYLGLVFLLGISIVTQNFCACLARGYGKNVEFAVSGVLNTLGMVCVNVLLLVFLKHDYSALYIASIVGNVIQILFLSIKCKIFSGVRFQLFESALLGHMLRFSLPLCLNSVAFWLLSSYNRVVINRVMTLADNGVYAIGNKFSTVITLVTSCFLYAWQEISFSRDANAPDNGPFYSTACNSYMLFLGGGVVLLLPVISMVFPFLVNDAYSAAKATIPLFLLMTMVNAYSTFVGSIFHALKNTNITFISMVIACICNVLVGTPFIRLWGLNGANLAVTLSFLVNITVRALILHRKIGFQIDFRGVLFLACAVGASSYISLGFGWVINLIWTVLCAAAMLYGFRKPIFSIVGRLLPRRKHDD